MDATTPDRRITITEAERKTGLHRSTLWRKYRAIPPEFPVPTYVGERRTWLESQIDKWITEQAARPAEARRGAANLKKVGAA